ncbi:alpha/beta hydrolase [Schaalia vaccimaxillae]|uniref:alpha/beta hydrolase n=1 Tax=Schaalia vaccimaxillae TaxID=183916 RepID=UPI0003B65D40|nr:alpha/beta fold hydrolase [Schaalia vaccimaxillae]
MPSASDQVAHRVEIPSTRGTLIGNLYPTQTPASSPLLIMCHGFADTQDSLVEKAQLLADLGVSCLTFDFIGGAPDSASGGSMMNMSVLTQCQELNDVIDWAVLDKLLPFSSLALSGESQGGLVAGLVAAERTADIDALVLFYPALSLPGNIRRQYPQGAEHDHPSFLGFKVGERYLDDGRQIDAYGQVGRYLGPILIYHGSEDGLVPLGSSRKFASEHPNTRLFVLDGVGHGLFGSWRIQKCCEEIRTFLDSAP